MTAVQRKSNDQESVKEDIKTVKEDIKTACMHRDLQGNHLGAKSSDQEMASVMCAAARSSDTAAAAACVAAHNLRSFSPSDTAAGAGQQLLLQAFPMSTRRSRY